ncbi:hypothetical protein JD844_000804 [Phrynosoma platyrhinos]|uniref:Uncharacterized protein n=1 Tax=Phrynosoma platyrhinos TaxID=52577 RepID=A0ABQ7T980_PHRPL|nr:hypothetical protein JD844_000804 [Phrynosoma platyrhinos]
MAALMLLTQRVFVSPVILILLILAHSRVPGTEGCMQCGAQFKNLKIRFARLCAQYRERFPHANCTKHPWGRGSVQGFALDEASLDLLLEKTHRVFRVIEINQSLSDFPKYWNWLHEVKMPEQSREEGAASVFNCSTCLRTDVPCWDLKTCYPDFGSVRELEHTRRLNRRKRILQ